MAPTGWAATAWPTPPCSAASRATAWPRSWGAKVGARRTRAAIEAGIARAEYPFSQTPGDLLGLRERVWHTMWDEVGVLRDEAGIKRGLAKLEEHEAELDHTGLADGDRRFNLTWHDWLNVKSLLMASKVIATAALAREDSRGAHYREDFPETGDLETSRYTRDFAGGRRPQARNGAGALHIVQPGQSLLDPNPVAAE